MEEKLLDLFTRIRESFGEIKEKVSLIKPYFELVGLSSGWALKIEEFERLLGFKPEYLYQSSEEKYAIAILYRVDDELTTGIIAHEFAELLAREKGISDHELADKICVEKGFGEQLFYALEDDIISEMTEREFLVMEDLEKRIDNLKRLLNV